MAKAPNYSDELTASIVSRYNAGETVETIADDIGKAVRSVRSKLVREGAYIAPEKPVAAKREEGPTKKELLRELELLVPFNVDGFMGVTKDTISMLIAHFEGATAETEVVTEAA